MDLCVVFEVEVAVALEGESVGRRDVAFEDHEGEVFQEDAADGGACSTR